MPKKNFLPKDIKDLEEIEYNPNHIQRKKRYQSFKDSVVIDQLREEDAKRLMKNFGGSVKIPKLAGIKTPDFKIEESKIVYEVTSIQCSEDERLSGTIEMRYNQDFIDNLDRAIDHALEKDYSNFSGYLRAVIVYIDEILSNLARYTQLSTVANIKLTNFSSCEIDFLIISPIPLFTDKKMEFTAYCKEDCIMSKLEENLPANYNVFKI